jgi:AhpC/TSA family
MRSDIAPGGTFPDYELPDHESLPRKLSEIQGDDPLILTLARGNYCPKEHQQHLELAANYPKVAVAYTKIATISTDTHHASQEFRASTGAQWTLPSVDADVLRFLTPRSPGRCLPAPIGLAIEWIARTRLRMLSVCSARDLASGDAVSRGIRAGAAPRGLLGRVHPCGPERPAGPDRPSARRADPRTAWLE